MDEKQPIAAQPVQDRSPLVFFGASSAPDPDQSSSHWQYVSVAGVLSPGSWCLPGRRRRYEDTRHCCRAIVFRGTATDPERAAFFTSTRPTDSDPCARHQRGQLLLLRLGRYFRSPTQQTTVRPERCGATDFLGKEVRPHNSTAP